MHRYSTDACLFASVGSNWTCMLYNGRVPVVRGREDKGRRWTKECIEEKRQKKTKKREREIPTKQTMILSDEAKSGL